MAEKVLMKGNEAFAEAVIRGGCRFYYGYPITPQSEIPEYMSRELPKRGGTFLQSSTSMSSPSSLGRNRGQTLSEVTITDAASMAPISQASFRPLP